MTAREAHLAEALRADPYAAGFLAETIVLRLLRGADIGPHLSGLATMSSDMASLLSRVAMRPECLSGGNGLYWLNRVDAGEQQKVEAARQAVASLLGTPPANLLVEWSRQPVGPTFAHVVDDSFSYICFNAAEVADDPAAVVHEIAHAMLVTRNRYLDEGLARYCEISIAGEWAAAEARVAACPPLFPGVRGLLRYDAARDPYFEKLGAPVASLVHDHAALVVRAISTRTSDHGLRAFCKAVRDGALGGDHVAAIEAQLNCPVEALDPLKAGAAAEGTEDADPALIDLIRRAMLRLDSVGIKALRSRLELEFPLERPTLGTAALEAWCRVQLHELLGGMLHGFMDEASVAVADETIERYRTQAPNGPMAHLFQALIGIAYLALEDNQMSGLARMAQVRQQFERALRIDRFNVDCLYQKARFDLLTPDEYAVGRSDAIATLRQLCRHTQYGAEVRAGVERSGWLDRVAAVSASPAL